MKRLSVTMAPIVVALVALQPAAADFDDGRDAFLRYDHEAALENWQSLVERGDARAQYGLGMLFFNGYGVPQDYVMALMWWQLAATQGLDEARVARDALIGQMTPWQIEEARRLAHEWMLEQD